MNGILFRTGLLSMLALSAWISLSLGLYRAAFAGSEHGLWSGWSQTLAGSLSGAEERAGGRAEKPAARASGGPSQSGEQDGSGSVAGSGAGAALGAGPAWGFGAAAGSPSPSPYTCPAWDELSELRCDVAGALPEHAGPWRLNFPGSFPRGSSLPLPEPSEQEFLQCLAQWLNSEPDLLVCISGYANEMPGQELNQRLAQARISYLKGQLVARGVAESRLMTGSVWGAGSSSPDGVPQAGSGTGASPWAEPGTRNWPNAQDASLILSLFVPHDA